MSTVLIKMYYKYFLASLIQVFICPILLAVLLRGRGLFCPLSNVSFFFGGGGLKDLEDMSAGNFFGATSPQKLGKFNVFQSFTRKTVFQADPRYHKSFLMKPQCFADKNSTISISLKKYKLLGKGILSYSSGRSGWSQSIMCKYFHLMLQAKINHKITKRKNVTFHRNATIKNPYSITYY